MLARPSGQSLAQFLLQPTSEANAAQSTCLTVTEHVSYSYRARVLQYTAVYRLMVQYLGLHRGPEGVCTAVHRGRALQCIGGVHCST